MFPYQITIKSLCRRGSGNIIASPGNNCGEISHCGLTVGGMEMSAAARKICTSPRFWASVKYNGQPVDLNIFQPGKL